MDLFRNMGATVPIKDSGNQAEQAKRLILKSVLLVCLVRSLGLHLEQDYWELGFYFRLWHCVFGKKKPNSYIFQCLGLPLFQEYCSTSCKCVVRKLMNTKPGCFLREKSYICANGIKSYFTSMWETHTIWWAVSTVKHPLTKQTHNLFRRYFFLTTWYLLDS